MLNYLQMHVNPIEPLGRELILPNALMSESCSLESEHTGNRNERGLLESQLGCILEFAQSDVSKVVALHSLH